MIEPNSAVDIPSPSPSCSHTPTPSTEDGIPTTNNTQIHGSRTRQCNTARGKRFSQKLVDAANRPHFTRMQLPTPSTSSSLSPPPHDNDTSTDISSRSTTPHHMTLNDTQPEEQRSITNTPLLSAKPKRRKLKQQRTTSWRIGADATLDTNVVHELLEESQHSAENDRHQHDHQQHDRRNQRAAKQRAKTKLNKKKSDKKPPLTLGDTTTDNDNMDTNGNINNYQRKHHHRRQQPSDIVDLRLTQIMYIHDTLDLDTYSIIPKKPTLPVYIELDDDDDDTNDIDKRPHHNSNHVDLTSPPPSPSLSSSRSLQSTTSDNDNQKNGHADIRNVLPAITTTTEASPCSTSSSPALSTSSTSISTSSASSASTTSSASNSDDS